MDLDRRAYHIFGWPYINEYQFKKVTTFFLMKKQLLILPTIFLLILLVFFYLLIIDRNPTELPSTLLNKNVPKFETESLLKEKKFVSSNVFGKKIKLVNFFATWCKPCRDEHNYIKDFSNQEGIEVIGLIYKDNEQIAIDWLKELGNPYSNIAVDKNGRIAIDWGVYGIPETFVVNSMGIIKYRHVGPITKKIYKKINLIISEIE